MRGLIASIAIMAAVLAGTFAPARAQPAEGQAVRHHGVLIRVPDLARARHFYADLLGFETEAVSAGMLRLADDMPIYLEQVTSPLRPPAADEARAAVAFRTANLDVAIARLRARGVAFLSERPINVGVGVAIRFRDPFGNIHALLQQTVGTPQPVDEPEVYNSGLKQPDSDTAALRALFGRLGFIVRTESYYPPSLPLVHRDGSFAFMLHENEREEPEIRARTDPHSAAVSLVFTTDDFGPVRAALGAAGDEGRFPLGGRLRVVLPSGVPIEIWQLNARRSSGEQPVP